MCAAAVSSDGERVIILDRRTGRPTGAQNDMTLSEHDAELLADGISVPSRVITASAHECYVRVERHQLPSALPLLAVDIGSIAARIQHLEFALEGGWFETLGPILRASVALASSLDVPEGSDPSALRLRFEFDPDLLNWAQPWGIQAVVNALQASAHQDAASTLEVDSLFDEVAYFWCDVKLPSNDESLSDVLARYTPAVQQAFADAHDLLIQSSAADKLVTRFAFPDSIRNACEQYLLYFAQFIRDLGVETETGVTEDAGSVLFSVRPLDGPDALHRVRDALNVYLGLPTDPTLERAVEGLTDIAVHQLHANVLHLRSQIALAHAVMQAKDATIDALRLSNVCLYQITGHSSGMRVIQGPVDTGITDTKSEPLLGEYVAVRSLEVKGLTINLPALLRSLKRRFTN